MKNADKRLTSRHDRARGGLAVAIIAALCIVSAMFASAYLLEQSRNAAALEHQRQSLQQLHRDAPQLIEEYRQDYDMTH